MSNDTGGYDRACGPAALAALAGIDRTEAARLLDTLNPHRDRGRRTSKGWTFTSTMIEALTKLGFTTVFSPEHTGLTLARWTREHSYGGTFLVLAARHFVVVRNGQVVEDNTIWPARGRVRVVYRVTDPSKPDQSGDRPVWPVCKCGCSATVRPGVSYKPGHDARHVSILFHRVTAGELSDDFALAQLADSPKLYNKLNLRIQRHLDANASAVV